MASVNMASVLAKSKSFMKTEAGQAKIQKAVDTELYIVGVAAVRSLAERFIKILRKEIENNVELSQETKDMLLCDFKIGYSAPIKTSSNNYKTTISFQGNSRRESVAPDRYGGIDDIVLLLNNGAVAANPIYGEWDGHRIKTKTEIPSAGFIDNAIQIFNSENFNARVWMVD